MIAAAKMTGMTPAMFTRERHVGRAAGRLSVAELSPRVLHRDPPLALLHEDDGDDDRRAR